MSLTPNTLDGILLSILFIFAFLAFLKGFIKEFFSTLNLIISIIASYLIAPIFAKFISIALMPHIAVQIVIRFIVFVTILIICSILSARVSTPLSTKIPSSVNQFLGFGFGFFKGYLMLSFCFAMLVFFYSNPFSQIMVDEKDNSNSTNLATNLAKHQKFGPKWLQDSKSYSILECGADLLRPAVETIFASIEDNINKNDPLSDKVNSIDNINTKLKTDDTDQKLQSDTNKSSEYGYSKQDLKKMQRLIEITNDKNI